MTHNWKLIGGIFVLLCAISLSGYFVFADFSSTDPTNPINGDQSEEYPSISLDSHYEEPPTSLSEIYQTHSSKSTQISHRYTYTQTINETEKVSFETYYNFPEEELYKDATYTGETDIRVEQYVNSNRKYTRQSTADESESTVESVSLESAKAEFGIVQLLSNSNYTGLEISYNETIETESGEYYVYNVNTAENSGDWESHTGTIVVSRSGVLISYDVTSTLKSGETYTHQYEITSTSPEFNKPLWVDGV